MLGLSPWLSLVAVLAAAALAWIVQRFAPRIEPSVSTPLRMTMRALDHRWTPVVVGVLSAAALWYAWGGLNRLPKIHDETAYLLQARIFASGAWYEPSPPHPEFFEQLYVLVVPVLASKYPPGHSLLLALGALVGVPGLVVVILGGVTSALIFALARRVAGNLVGLLTLLLFLSNFPAMYYRATYFSEVTSGTAWMASWYCLLRWHEMMAPPGSEGAGDDVVRARLRRRWLIGLAVSVGIVAITRPFTAIALAIPIAVVVLRDTIRQRSWRDFVLAVVVGSAVVAVIPLWSARTTGIATLTPHRLYVDMYEPHNMLGFGVDTTRRAFRGVPKELASTNHDFLDAHREHTVTALPRTIVRRAERIVLDMWYEWRLGSLPVALLALVGMSSAVGFALAGFGVHFLLYLLYAHPPAWTLYYLESEPVFALLTAIGVMRAVAWAAGHRGVRSEASATSLGARLATLALAIALCIPLALTLRTIRTLKDREIAYFEQFERLVMQIPDGRAMVFVRYGPEHNRHLSLVRNPARHATARVWIVHDRGADNARLIAAAPERRPYLFDEATLTLSPYSSPTR